MNISKIRITDAQNLLLQGLLSIFAGAGLAFITASVQYITQHGAISISTALSVGLAAGLYTFGVALKAFVPSHVSQEMQALQDTIKQLQDALTRITATSPVVAQPINTTPVQPSQTISSPLVVINHPGSQPSAVEVAYNNALATQQPLQGVVQNASSVPVQTAQAAPVLMDDFPSNPVVPAVSMPTHLAALTNMATLPQPSVPQIPFPENQDTLTGVQAARARAGIL